MTDARARGVLAFAWLPHHVDHLAPWCSILNAPLCVDGRTSMAAAAGLYPDLEWFALPDTDGSSRFEPFARRVRELAPRVLLCSELFERWYLRELFGGTDAPRFVYVPHGFSEKRQDWARETAYQDVAVFYGEHAQDQLAELGAAGILDRWIVSGNLRAAWHRRHAAHFRAQLGPLGELPPAGRTILYAPTWADAIGSSSFFDAFAPFARSLPEGWRLIAKLHPRLERHVDVIDTLGSLAAGRDIHLVRGSPLTYPLLALADAYVGDMSALAYDFLATGRPMFFTHQTAGTAADASSSRLFACGTEIPPGAYADVVRIVDEAWPSDAERFGEARAALDRYTHAPERPFDELVRELHEATSGPAPDWMGGRAASHERG